MKKFAYVAATFALIIIAAVFFRAVFKTVTPASSNLSATTSEFPLPAISDQNPGTMIALPQPITDGSMSLEKAISLRRSVRSYVNQPLSIEELSQLLWAGQGINNERGFRTAPSAGATFPLELFVMVNNVAGLKKGLYHYQIGEHALKLTDARELEGEVARASLSQSMISDAGVVIIFTAIFDRTTSRYGERGIRYIHNEVGHVSQNIHLQVSALNLGTVVIGAYRDEEVEAILNLGEEFRVLYMMPIGKI
ncbi:MAG: SagB/ThcOx family dehydrogenase [Bacteroidales bacterium]|nr:SagB/ThcOx family dehydrogenase [Bacteroidales bacterium]